LLAALLGVAYVAGQQSAIAQSQLEMDEQSNVAFLKADKQLNAIYKKIVGAPDLAPITKKKLIASEKCWIDFREGEANYEASVGGEGGSIYPMLYNGAREQLTLERIKQLKKVSELDAGR
jgi:uncharacterized protein YecT (DUF1311 family)